MKTPICHALALLLLIANAAWCAPERPVSVVDVRDFGAAGDGTTDDTAAFEKAMAAFGKTGGTVTIPVGNYRIGTHLSIPNNVTLEGVWKIPTAWTANQGSTLLAVEGEGSEEGPAFITLGTNSTLKGVTVYYPNQRMDSIRPYPWCIASSGGDNSSIVDCLLVNPYQAVDFGTRNSGRHYIRGLYGQPLRRGVFVDKCYDVGRIENVHFWPFWGWDGKPELQKWLWENGEAFIFGRTDWEYVFNTFVFGYKIGYRFIQTPSGSMNGNLLGIGADAANVAVLVEQSQKPGLLITNGQFVSIGAPDPTEVVVTATHDGVVLFQNCSFWGPARQIARVAGKGVVSFGNCNFLTWGYGNANWTGGGPHIPAIEHFGGKLTVMGCTFGENKEQLWVRGETASAIFAANQLAGPLRVRQSSGGILETGLNMPMQIKAPPLPVRPKEETGSVVVDDADGPPGVQFSGKWHVAVTPSNYYRSVHWAMKGSGDAAAVFRPMVPKAGRYDVFVYVSDDPMSDHATDAPVTVRSSGGASEKRINTYKTAGSWQKIGTFPFARGRKGEIMISNDASGNVVADAVKLVPAR